MVAPPSGIWCVSRRQAFSRAKAFDVDHLAGETGGVHRGLALLDVLRCASRRAAPSSMSGSRSERPCTSKS
jgi:hypothetical protein